MRSFSLGQPIWISDLLLGTWQPIPWKGQAIHSPPVGASAMPSAASYIQQYHLMEWNPQQMEMLTFLAWWWSREGPRKPCLCLKGKDKGGLTSLPFWMEGWTHNFTFTSNMIIPSRGQYVLKYNSMCLIIQLHPHIPVTHSLQFSSEKTSRA